MISGWLFSILKYIFKKYKRFISNLDLKWTWWVTATDDLKYTLPSYIDDMHLTMGVKLTYLLILSVFHMCYFQFMSLSGLTKPPILHSQNQLQQQQCTLEPMHWVVVDIQHIHTFHISNSNHLHHPKKTPQAKCMGVNY